MMRSQGKINLFLTAENTERKLRFTIYELRIKNGTTEGTERSKDNKYPQIARMGRIV